MISRLLACVLLLGLGGLSPLILAAPSISIDVVDWYAMAAPQTGADSVALLAYKNEGDVFHSLNRRPRLAIKPLRRLCSSLPEHQILEQPTLKRCTAFLVAPDRVVTAGHCVKRWALSACQAGMKVKGLNFVFDFRMTSATQVETLDTADIVQAKQVIDCKVTPTEDWAVIALASPVNDRPVLTLSAASDVPVDGDAVRYLGHPLGLPIKESTGIVARAFDASGKFGTSLKSANGASGSPVFDAKGEVVGLMFGSGAPQGRINECWNIAKCEWPDTCSPARVVPVARFRNTALQ